MNSAKPVYRRIRSVFLAEFDNVAGPRNSICIQPDNVPTLPSEIFAKVYEFWIPRRSLHGKVTTIGLENLLFIGKPTQIEGTQYERNAYLFNIGFILDSSKVDGSFIILSMTPIVRKLSEELRILEIERGLLSRQDWQSRSFLRKSFRDMVNQLFKKGQHFLVFDNSHFLYLRVLSEQYLYCSREDCSLSVQLRVDHVPVPLHSSSLLSSYSADIDVSVYRASLYINGVNSIYKIASCAAMDLNLTKTCIQKLIHEHLVACVGTFRFRNRYEATQKLISVRKNYYFWKHCDLEVHKQRSCKIDNAIMGSSNFRSVTKPCVICKSLNLCFVERNIYFSDLDEEQLTSRSHQEDRSIIESIADSKHYMLYRQLERKEPLGYFFERNLQHFENIDIRKWITFGLLSGIICRIYEFPVCMNTQCLQQLAESLTADSTSCSDDVASRERKIMRQSEIMEPTDLLSLFNGRYNLDELSCLLNVSISTLDKLLQYHAKDFKVWWIQDSL
eukprot:jgi/Galph1/936/GphlegSOOS_G5592.1